MRHTQKKLRLRGEIVRALAAKDLTQAIGGADSTRCAVALNTKDSCQDLHAAIATTHG
jgi:hypothetical protein